MSDDCADQCRRGKDPPRRSTATGVEEIYAPHTEVTLEDEDDDHKTNQPLSEREVRELFKMHQNLGHPKTVAIL